MANPIKFYKGEQSKLNTLSNVDESALYFGTPNNGAICGQIKLGTMNFSSSIYNVEYIESTEDTTAIQVQAFEATTTVATTSSPITTTTTTPPVEPTTEPTTQINRTLKLTYANGNVINVSLPNENIQQQINEINSSINTIKETNSLLFQKLSQEDYDNLSDGDKNDNVLYCIID